MSSPVNPEIKDSTFPATDPNPSPHDDDQQQPLKEGQTPPHPQSPKPVTLEIPDADEPNPSADDPNPDDAEETAPVSPTIPNLHTSTTTSTLTFSRRGGGGGRRKKRHPAQEKKSQKKLEALSGNLNLIPFVPVKSLDLASHETLLRRLGLWDFAHLDFNFKLRHDLILQLIASFIPTSRGSEVNEVRIKVGRADLARALCLPVKKEKADGAMEVKETEESVSFIQEFVSSFILLHDDIWMMTEDILSTMKLIKERNFEKVDFAKLIWTMVEKELNDKELRNCYYASHLQLLIKSQREDLLKEHEPVNMEIDLKDDDEEDEGVKMSEELPVTSELEEQNIELSLGGLDSTVRDDSMKEKLEQEQVQEEEQGQEQEKEQEQPENEVDPMDFKENKDNEQNQWLNNSNDGNFLQQCNLGGIRSSEFEEREQEEEEDGEEEEEEDDEDEEEEDKEEEMGFRISPKGVTLQGIDSDNLIEAVEASQNPFNISESDFLISRLDSKQMGPGSSGLFNNGNTSKRIIDHLDSEMPHHKRIRGDDHWENLKPESEFDFCLEQMQDIAGKARMLYEAKEQELQNLSLHNQMLLNELDQRTSLYQHNLAKAKVEEQQKRQVETYRLEHELYMMGNLLEGYRKALKETSRAFSEYRKKFPSPEEPIYKDTGSGGLVLSANELERQRLKREEEERLNRLLIERKIKEFEGGWVNKLEEYKIAVGFMGNRLLEVEKGVNFCKEEFARRKDELMGNKMAECAPSEEQVSLATAD